MLPPLGAVADAPLVDHDLRPLPWEFVQKVQVKVVIRVDHVAVIGVGQALIIVRVPLGPVAGHDHRSVDLDVGVVGADVVFQKRAHHNDPAPHLVQQRQKVVSSGVGQVLLRNDRRGEGQQRGDPPVHRLLKLGFQVFVGVAVVNEDRTAAVPPDLRGTVDVLHRNVIVKLGLHLVQSSVDQVGIEKQPRDTVGGTGHECRSIPLGQHGFIHKKKPPIRVSSLYPFQRPKARTAPPGKRYGQAYSFFTKRARTALRTARTMTPTSAKMASHMLARPRAPRSRHRPLTPMANTMFW